jgi:LacI family transcriptional regulator
MRAAVEAGLRVPEDLSVIGFDGVPLGELTEPPLTTVAQPTERKGELAAQALLQALESGVDEAAPPDPMRTILPTELVIRGSTGPARG